MINDLSVTKISTFLGISKEYGITIKHRTRDHLIYSYNLLYFSAVRKKITIKLMKIGVTIEQSSAIYQKKF